MLLNVKYILAVKVNSCEYSDLPADCQTVILLDMTGSTRVDTAAFGGSRSQRQEITPYMVGTSLLFDDVVALIEEASQQ